MSPIFLLLVDRLEDINVDNELKCQGKGLRSSINCLFGEISVITLQEEQSSEHLVLLVYIFLYKGKIKLCMVLFIPSKFQGKQLVNLTFGFILFYSVVGGYNASNELECQGNTN